ncbi:MAG: hypothetical protein O3C40_24165 [Planctomycetota bacterium]|nr:hypothetical protein [Planctomycetota bacterium]
MTAVLLLGDPALRADDFDSLINLELAFRDTILDQPAPRHYQSLIRDGETTITFVRDLPGRVGKTDFLLNLDWSYDYRYATQTTDGITEVSVTPRNIKLTPRLRHVIRMPVAFYHAEVWESQLLGHEFDHVSVSLDPRPRALLLHLCSDLPTYRFSMEGTEKPSDARMREGINREIQRRQSAILDLLRANYVALDKVSQHGRTAMEDRSDFFESLYTRPTLEASGFPFLKEVRSVLESDEYRQLRSRHVPADPVATPPR